MIDGNNYVVLNFDGAANPNHPVTSPRFSTTRTSCGFVVKSASGQVLHREGVFLGNGTSNTAELQGCLLGLTWCLQNGFRRVKVRGDSENVVKYLSGTFRIPRHHPHIARLLQQISRVLAVESVSYREGTGEDQTHDRRLRLLASDPLRVIALEVERVSGTRNRKAHELAAEALHIE